MLFQQINVDMLQQHTIRVQHFKKEKKKTNKKTKPREQDISKEVVKELEK